MRIIPAIDILNGRCVRLTKGDYAAKTVYNEKPLEVAKAFEDAGLSYLHLVDLDGARSSHIINHKVLHQIATKTQLKIDFGGGIKSYQDVRIAFENGASQITAGSIAVKHPELFLQWLSTYGNDKIMLGADAAKRKIATHGWMQSSDWDVVDFIESFQQKGVKYVVCTDIAKDGMLQGTSASLYKEILQKVEVHLIASGGVTTLDDLIELKETGCEAAIIGKAIYEGRISLPELKKLC